jgi:2-amino-4-hydroxy-6-hydroxymethyldihydropteridine diphosphokinase
MSFVFLGLGSNIGDKKENLLKTVAKISRHKHIKLIKCSSFYKTPPVGFKEQEPFLNCVLKIETDLSIYDLLKVTQEIEKSVGRKKTFKWGPRVIDVDILFYDNDKIDEPELKVPHPLVSERAFVLLPFAEIEKEFVHPILNKTIEKLLFDLPEEDLAEIKKIN